MGRFDGKTAIVTGGSLGLGRAIAERLASEGAKVLITGRDPERLAEAAEQIDGEVLTLAGDIAEDGIPQAIAEHAVGQWGQIDVLVNNAGVYDENGFLEQQRRDWDYVLAVLLTGPYFLAQACARHMVERGAGAIVNIASIDGHGADGPYPAYGAAKAGIINVTKYMAVALGPHGVRANSISPGWIDTPMVASLGELYDRLKAGFKRVPAQRLLEATEVAAVVAFLASDEASGVTGSDYLVDGGTLADVYVIPTTED